MGFWDFVINNTMRTTTANRNDDLIKEIKREIRIKKGLNPNKPSKKINYLDVLIHGDVQDSVKPKVGSVIHCGLLFNQIDHSGIYVGYNKIVHLDGSGRVEIVTPAVFLDRLDGFNLAVHIYVGCLDGNPIGSKKVAQRARSRVGDKLEYSVHSNNCHMFTSGCLTGSFKNKDRFFSLLEETAEKEFNINQWKIWDMS